MVEILLQRQPATTTRSAFMKNLIRRFAASSRWIRRFNADICKFGGGAVRFEDADAAAAAAAKVDVEDENRTCF